MVRMYVIFLLQKSAFEIDYKSREAVCPQMMLGTYPCTQFLLGYLSIGKCEDGLMFVHTDIQLTKAIQHVDDYCLA